MEISNIEIGFILKFLNTDGYVLDFTTAEFDTFTQASIGIALCEKYHKSKGRSLIAYVNSAEKSKVLKLLNDLILHYELSSEKEHDEQYNKERAIAYKKCKTILDKASLETPHITVLSESLKEEFNSDYINNQLDLMMKMEHENPTEAIGKAKELIESCCKTILEKENINIDKRWDIIRLVDETFKYFNIMPRDIPDDKKGANTIKAILGNLKAIAHGIAELRNPYGSGHGKSGTYIGLQPRHASLAIGSSITLTRFLWDSYEFHKNKEDKIL